MDELEQKMNQLCNVYPFHIGWSLVDLYTQDHIARNGDIVVRSASTRKIAILIATLQLIRVNVLKLDQRFVLQEKYKTNTSGVFEYLQANATITLQDALTMMIVVSDNTCTGGIVELIGLEAINNFSKLAGMKNTLHRYGYPTHNVGRERFETLPLEKANVTTPNDVAHLLNLIVQGSTNETIASKIGVNRTLCTLALTILSEQKLNSRLPALLPRKTRIDHKTGTQAYTFNDAGIIYNKEIPRFILSVYTDNVPDELPNKMPGHSAATEAIGKLCRMCYDYFIAKDLQ